MKTLLRAIAIAAVATQTSIWAGAPPVSEHNDSLAAGSTKEYRVTLALSGGGARGLASIGVLRAFEEKGITVGAIAGTSMGGIVGGLYACGYSATELQNIFRSVDFSTLFANKPPRLSMFLTQRQERDQHLLSVRFDNFKPRIPQGLTEGQKLTSLLATLTVRATYRAGGDFTQLPIPFKAVTTDIVTGRMVVLSSGSLADALRATMAFPLAFTGVESGDQILMDGGMIAPVPAEVARTMADSGLPVVAVNTTSPLAARGALVTPFDIADQVTSIMTTDELQRQLAFADFVLTPSLGDFTNTEFSQRDSIIERGYEAGLAAADSIRVIIDHAASIVSTFNKPMLPTSSGKDPALVSVGIRGNSLFPDSVLNRLLVKDSAPLTLSAINDGLKQIENLYHQEGYDFTRVSDIRLDSTRTQATVAIDEGIIRRIDVRHNKRTKDWLIRSYFPLKMGQPYSTRQAERGMANIYGTDLFERVSVDFVPERDSGVVVISVDEKAFVQTRFGWHWHDQFQSEELFEFLNDNLFGIGMEYRLQARYGLQRQYYMAEVKTNRILSTYMTGQIKLYNDRLNRNLFDTEGEIAAVREERTLGAAISLGQQIARLGTVSAGLTVEQVKSKLSGSTESNTDRIRAFTLESLVETFDRMPFPCSGKKHLLEIEASGKFLGGSAVYTRLFSSLEAYFPLGRKLNYHPKVSLGLSSASLPVSEQFYAGGLGSFAGLRSFQLSGDKIALLNQELRIKLPLRLFIIGRFDVGQVYDHLDELKLTDLRQAGGGSIAFDSPIGPVEFGYGQADGQDGRLYFNAGLSF